MTEGVEVIIDFNFDRNKHQVIITPNATGTQNIQTPRYATGSKRIIVYSNCAVTVTIIKVA